MLVVAEKTAKNFRGYFYAAPCTSTSTSSAI